MLEISVGFVDSSDSIVEGESESTVGLRIVASTGVAVVMRDPSTMLSGPVYERLTNGKATIRFMVDGATSYDDSTTLQLFCPRINGKSNPCTALDLAPAATVPLVVASPTTSVDVTALLARYAPTIRFRISITSLSLLNTTHLLRILLQELQTNCTSWPASAAVDRLELTACEVKPNEVAVRRIRDAVCSGKANICAQPYESRCPQGIRMCVCPADSLASFLQQQPQAGSQRRLLQIPDVTQPSLVVQAELRIALTSSDVTTPDIVALVSSVLGLFMVDALRHPEYGALGVLADSLELYLGDNSTATNTTSLAAVTTPLASTTPAPTSSAHSGAGGLQLCRTVAAACLLVGLLLVL